MMYYSFVIGLILFVVWNFLPVYANFLSMNYGPNLDAIRKAQGQLQGISTGQYPPHMEISSLRIIKLKPHGSVHDIKNLYTYTGLVLKQHPVTFVTEQKGYGDISAYFNGVRVGCNGVPGARFKQCIVPASMRPWAGRFVVRADLKNGRTISASFSMAANAVCANRGLKGNNCNQDVNECEKFKDRRICAWKDGCVNTIGSYRCRCPQGYAVSKTDFRNCDAILPKITTASKVLTVLYHGSVELPCQYKGPVLRKRLWLKDSNVIVSETNAGVLLPNVKPQRFSLSKGGTLKISSVKFADQGIYTCTVQTVAGITTRRAHMVKIETIPLLGIKFQSNGKYSVTKEFQTGDTINVECQALTIPRGTITWKDANGKKIVESKRYKFHSGQLPNYQTGAIYNRLQIKNASMSDNRKLICHGQNARGTASRSVSIVVKPSKKRN